MDIIELGPYRLIINKALFLQLHKINKRIDIPLKLENVVVSCYVKNADESYVLFVEKNNSKAVILEFYYPEQGKGGIRIDMKTLTFPFTFSDNVRIKTSNPYAALIDNNHWAVIKLNKVVYSGTEKSSIIDVFIDAYQSYVLLEQEDKMILTDGRVSISFPKQGKIKHLSQKGEWFIITTTEKEYHILPKKEFLYYETSLNKFKNIVENSRDL